MSLFKQSIVFLIFFAGIILTAMPMRTDAAETVSYLDENQETKTISATVVDDKTTKLTSGWYVVNQNSSLSGEIPVEGKVYLILANDTTLEIEKSLTLNNEDDELTIYGQKKGNGTLKSQSETAATIVLRDSTVHIIGSMVRGGDGSGNASTATYRSGGKAIYANDGVTVVISRGVVSGGNMELPDMAAMESKQLRRFKLKETM